MLAACRFSGVLAAQGVDIGGNLRASRLTDLPSSPLGVADFVLGLGAKNNPPNALVAYAAGGTQLFSVARNPQRPLQDLIDLADLDGDGFPEVIGIFRGDLSNPGVLYIYDTRAGSLFTFATPLKTSLSPGAVKVLPAGVNRRQVVLVANTFNSALSPDYANQSATSSIPIWFCDKSACTAKATVPGTGPVGNREILTFPATMIGDVDGNAATQEVVIIVKSRILVLNSDGSRRAFTEIVSPGGNFTSYNASADKPGAVAGDNNCALGDPNLKWEGRRYGMYQLANIDSDGALELLVAADANPIITGSPGAVYEAYDLNTAADNTYFQRKWRTCLQRRRMPSTAPSRCPPATRSACRSRGSRRHRRRRRRHRDHRAEHRQQDSAAHSERPGRQSDPPAIGRCHTFPRRGAGHREAQWAGQAFADLITFDPAVGQHRIFRLQSVTSTVATGANLPDSDSPALATGAGILALREWGDDFPLPAGTGVNGDGGHTAVQVTRRSGVRAVVGFPADVCGGAVRSWTVSGGAVTSSLDVPVRPGKLINVLPDLTGEPELLFQLEDPATCALRTRVQTFKQQGSGLSADGAL